MCLVVFRKVTRHLDWRRNGNVQSELLPDGTANAVFPFWAALRFQVEYPWGVIHRSTQKARKRHRRNVIDEISSFDAPRVKLLTASTFTRYPVRPSTL